MFGFFYFNISYSSIYSATCFQQQNNSIFNYHFNCFPGFYTFLMDKGLIKVELRLWLHLYFH